MCGCCCLVVSCCLGFVFVVEVVVVDVGRVCVVCWLVLWLLASFVLCMCVCCCVVLCDVVVFCLILVW